MYEKEGEKIEKYQDFKREIGRPRGIRHLEVVLLVVGALGVVSMQQVGCMAWEARCYDQNGTVA